MNGIKFSVRQLSRSPLMVFVAILTLGLCFGTNLSIFAIVDAILLKALPYPDPDRLVVIHNAYPKSGVDRGKATITNYFERRGAVQAFESLAMIQPETYLVGEGESARHVPTGMITHEFFDTLGIPLAMGHTFTDVEYDYGPDKVAIISDRFWRDYFNADPNVLGRTMMMDSLKTHVIGVLPPGFRYLSSRFEIYRPNAHFPELRDPFSQFSSKERMPDGRTPVGRHSARARRHDGQMIARLGSQWSIVDAQGQLDALNAHLLSRDPLAETLTSKGFRAVVEPLHTDHVRSAKPIVVSIQMGAILLLCLGVINLGGLLALRASARSKEMAVRQALGAGRWDIAKGTLTETMILSLAGGLLGLVFAKIGIQLATFLGVELLPLGTNIAFDGRAAFVAVLMSCLAGLFIAVPIAIVHLQGQTNLKLQGEARGATSSGGILRFRHGLIVSQIAMASILLYGAGLLALSLKRTLDQPAGFEPGKVFSGELTLPWNNYREHAVVPFVYRLLERLRAVPGVSYAAVSTGAPFTIQGSSPSSILPEHVAPSSKENLRVHYRSLVTDEYWKAMGIPLLEGRYLDDTDSRWNAQRVAVVDQALADQYWPDGSAIGRRISEDPSSFDPKMAFTIVGIVGTVKQQQLSEIKPLGAVYLPYRSFPKFHVIVRAPGSVATMSATLQGVLRELDPGLPFADFKSMRMRIDDSLTTRRSPAVLALVFAGVAMLLAGIGVYGVLSDAVQIRRREVGVRMAFGARYQQIVSQFLGMGFRLLVFGAVIGTLAAVAVGKVMQSILFEVPFLHPANLVITVFVMAIVTLLACALPALRACRVSPMEALKNE